MPHDTTHTQTLRTRAYAGLPSTVDVETRSFDLTITTETPVRTWISDPRDPAKIIEVDEVLVAGGLDLSRAARMPLVDCHDVQGGIGKVLGRVDDIRVEGQSVVGRAVLTRKSADLAADIADGFFGQVSAGYVVLAYVIEERSGDVPLARAISWTLQETSLVPVGADPNASVRGARKFPAATVRSAENQETKMDYEKLVDEAERALRALEEAKDEGASDEVVERARKLLGRAEAEPENKEGGERAEGAADADKEEAAAAERARSIAKTYGCAKFAEDLFATGARAAEVLTGIRGEMLKRGAVEPSGTRAAVVAPKPKGGDSEQELSARSIYARLNNR